VKGDVFQVESAYSCRREFDGEFVARAWGAALVLVVLVLIFNVIARLIARRSRMA
jgi:ABC-type phosphate transport system permease subunit